MKFTGATSEQVLVSGRDVTFLADPGARLTDTSNGILLRIEGAGRIAVYDLEIFGASGSGNPGVSLQPGSTATVVLERVVISNNAGAGVSVASGDLTLRRSVVSRNQGIGIMVSGGSIDVEQSTITGNVGGGLQIGGVGVKLRVVNNFITRNGDADNGTFGGVNLMIATAGSNRFEFNTVVDNRAAINAGGVICNVMAFTAPNNIIARNALGMSTSAPDAQESGACTYPTSRIQNDVIGLDFVDSEVPAPFDYKLRSTSMAIDQATTASDIGVDIDGDVRPQGTAKDVGADEYRE